ncbi:MAG: DUF2269 family protein [Solirubrobacterales bacterium]|nr:DUF2269 family protein [Solirubrobacterales bacterium]
MLAITLYDTVLWLHIVAVIVAFGALFAYPVFFAVNASAPITERTGLHRAQIAFSKKVTGPVLGVVLLAGAYLASDRDYWSEVWVSVPLLILFVVAGLGATVLRRNEQALLDTATAGDDLAYAEALGKAKTWTLVILALVVVAVFFMTVKPFA